MAKLQHFHNKNKLRMGGLFLNLTKHILRLVDLLLMREVFVLLRPSTDWAKSTHVMYGTLIYSIPSSNVTVNQETETSKIMLTKSVSGHHGPTNVTHKSTITFSYNTCKIMSMVIIALKKKFFLWRCGMFYITDVFLII